MAGTLPLQSRHFVTAASGRPEFQIRMQRGWDSGSNYHVIGMKNGLLLLHLGMAGATAGQFDGTLGLVGGLLGGKLGRLVGNALEES